MADSDSPGSTPAAEAWLDGSGPLWRAVVEELPDPLMVIRPDRRIAFLNLVARRLYPDIAPGDPALDLVQPLLRPELDRSLDQIFAGGEPRAREFPIRFQSGNDRWLAAHTGPVRLRGAVVGAVVVARDITERRRIDAALRESEQRYRTLVEHATEAIVVFDVDRGRFVDVNRNATTLFGMSRDQLLDADPATLSPLAQPGGRPSGELARQYLDAALAGEAPSFEWVHRTAQGTERRCEVRLIRLPAEARRLVRGSISDVTRQRTLEEHLRQRQKLEALGQLAGGIAHDFNNILLVISASAGQISLLGAPGEARVEAERILEATRKGAALTRQLLDFARPQPTRGLEVDLNLVIREEVQLLARLLGGKIRLVSELTPGPLPVLAERNHLEQVLMNLLLNARDALPTGGSVIIRTSRLPEECPGGATAHRRRGPVVRLRVEDSGIGMEEQVRARVFEPFFTTKTGGHSTGLGLAIVDRLIRGCGGSIEVTSSPGKGTSFDVVLPAAPLGNGGA